MIRQKVSSHETQPIASQLFKNPEFHLHSFSGHLAVANYAKGFSAFVMPRRPRRAYQEIFFDLINRSGPLAFAHG